MVEVAALSSPPRHRETSALARRMVITVKRTNQPLFPLKVIHLDDGLTVELNDLKEVGTHLEFYDSDDPEDRQEVLVLDREGRPVRIFVYALEVKRCELYDITSLSEEDITHVIEAARQKRIEAQKQSVLMRLYKLFRRCQDR